ncbi:hypothetical protein HJFPF1_04255 [Paramyrothecium foliicola]|nr:hypothetical protein HJFPF1_04255 [Paramyrothecium foliicola]
MSSSSLKDYKCLTFDCYGTLIDWENGFVEAFRPLTNRLDPSHPLHNDSTALLRRYIKHEVEIQTESPTLQYSAILAKVYERISHECSLAEVVTHDEAAAFGASIGSWQSFPDTVEALWRLKKHFKLVILSNVDRDSFNSTLAGPLSNAAQSFDAIYVAEDIGSYKPDLRNFSYLIDRCKEELQVEKAQILHTAYSLPADLKPAKEIGLKGCLIERYPNILGGDVEAMKDVIAVDFRFGTLDCQRPLFLACDGLKKQSTLINHHVQRFTIRDKAMGSVAKLVATLFAFQLTPVLAQSAHDATNDGSTEIVSLKVINDAFRDGVNATSPTNDALGYNLTQEFPGTEVDGWKIQLSVVGDFYESQSRHLTGAQVHYTAPQQLRNTTTRKSWGSCEWYGFIEYNETASVDPVCRDILSEECRVALSGTSICNGSQILPAACESELGGDDNRIQSAVSSTAGGFATEIGLTLHEPGDFEYYDKTIKRVIVSALGFTELRDGNISQVMEDGEKIPGVLSCLRADQFMNNARTLEEALEASSRKVSASLALLVAAAVVAVSLM